MDAILHATFGAQHLGMLASLLRYPGHVALAAGRAFPLLMSRYGELFLRRPRARSW